MRASPRRTASAASTDGLEAAAADLVDGHGVNTVREAGLAHCLASGGLAAAALEDLADDDFVDRCGRDRLPLEDVAQNLAGQLRCGDIAQSAAERAKGSAPGFNKKNIVHG